MHKFDGRPSYQIYMYIHIYIVVAEKKNIVSFRVEIIPSAI